MAYADKTFYKEKYLMERSPVINAGFPFYAMQASLIIDAYTHGRLKNLREMPDTVQMCCCELAESEWRREKRQKESGGKTSEKIGTYSVGFETGQDLARAAGNEQRSIVMKWLSDTGLCYQGE